MGKSRYLFISEENPSTVWYFQENTTEGHYIIIVYFTLMERQPIFEHKIVFTCKFIGFALLV